MQSDVDLLVCESVERSTFRMNSACHMKMYFYHCLSSHIKLKRSQAKRNIFEKNRVKIDTRNTHRHDYSRY